MAEQTLEQELQARIFIHKVAIAGGVLMKEYIDKETQGRLINLKEQSNDTKMCVFQLINLYVSINNGVDISGNVINYNQDQINDTIRSVVRKYLINSTLEDGTPYLYRGIK